MVKLLTLAAFALLPPYYMNCVVAIGHSTPVIVNGMVAIENGKPKMQWEPTASGFLYGEPTGQRNDKGEPLYSVFLVSNRHVFQGASALTLRFNPKDGKPAKEYPVSLVENGKQIWFAPPDPQMDVAVIFINLPFLRNDGIQADFIGGDEKALTLSQAKEVGVSEGDGVFVLGFPLQLVGGERNFVIARQGIVARISDTLQGFSKTFLVDTFIFPGNSGGPVVLRPELTSVTGTKTQSNSLLIGLVSSFQTYQEVAVSQQTGRPRIMFEENAGLANIIPVDQIEAAIAEYKKANPQK